jgi:hypothetical protein
VSKTVSAQFMIQSNPIQLPHSRVRGVKPPEKIKQLQLAETYEQMEIN